MNTSAHSKHSGFGLNVGKAGALAILCLGLVVFARPASAMIQELDGIMPMSDRELASAYGGFILPNGLNINLGLEIISAIKNSAGDALFKIHQHFSTGPLNSLKPVLSATVVPDNNGGTKIESNTDVGSIQDLASSQNQIIANTLNNAHIEQVQKLTIEISNFTKIFPGSNSALSGLQSQLLNKFRGGWN